MSFVRVVDEHTIDVRFFERGAGETMSSGTGSTGAAAAALAARHGAKSGRSSDTAGPLESSCRKRANCFWPGRRKS